MSSRFSVTDSRTSCDPHVQGPTRSHMQGAVRADGQWLPTVFDRVCPQNSPQHFLKDVFQKYPKGPQFTLHVWAAHSLVPRESKQGAESSVWLDHFR
jgi:hypothetical protein